MACAASFPSAIVQRQPSCSCRVCKLRVAVTLVVHRLKSRKALPHPFLDLSRDRDQALGTRTELPTILAQARGRRGCTHSAFLRAPPPSLEGTYNPSPRAHWCAARGGGQSRHPVWIEAQRGVGVGGSGSKERQGKMPGKLLVCCIGPSGVWDPLASLSSCPAISLLSILCHLLSNPVGCR